MVDETKETKKITPKEAEASPVPDKGQDLKESPETAPTVPASENTTEAEDKLARALEDAEPSNFKERETTAKETFTPNIPEAPPVRDINVEPIEPPKEGLVPKVPESNYSDGAVNPENVSGIGIPGADRPGGNLDELQEQIKTPPVNEVKKGMSGKGGIPDKSRQAEKLHNDSDPDKTA